MQPMIERVGSYEDLKRHVVTESSGLKMRRGVTTTLLVMLCLLCTPHIIAYPIGIGQEADNGCLCHGIAEESASINITGIPMAVNIRFTMLNPPPQPSEFSTISHDTARHQYEST